MAKKDPQPAAVRIHKQNGNSKSSGLTRAPPTRRDGRASWEAYNGCAGTHHGPGDPHRRLNNLAKARTLAAAVTI